MPNTITIAVTKQDIVKVLTEQAQEGRTVSQIEVHAFPVKGEKGKKTEFAATLTFTSSE